MTTATIPEPLFPCACECDCASEVSWPANDLTYYPEIPGHQKSGFYCCICAEEENLEHGNETLAYWIRRELARWRNGERARLWELR